MLEVLGGSAWDFLYVDEANYGDLRQGCRWQPHSILGIGTVIGAGQFKQVLSR